MAKPEREFADVGALPWTPVAGSAVAGAGGPGIEEKVLSREVLILDGSLVDLGLGRTFTAGMYACRPPGMPHRSYASPGGALLFETRYRA